MKIYFITVANKKKNELDILYKSAKQNNINLIILGLHIKNINMGHGYGFGWKLMLLRDYLANLEEVDIFIFVDAFDVVVVSSMNEIIKKFISFKSKIVFSGENYCSPDPNKNYLYKEKTPFANYLNSGTIIAYVGYFIKFYDENENIIDKRTDDQRYYTDLYLKHQDDKNLITLDRESKIFMCLAGVENLLEYDEQKKRFKNKQTGYYPCIIHANGREKSFITKFSKFYQQNDIYESFDIGTQNNYFFLLVSIIIFILIIISIFVMYKKK